MHPSSLNCAALAYRVGTAPTSVNSRTSCTHPLSTANVSEWIRMDTNCRFHQVALRSAATTFKGHRRADKWRSANKASATAKRCRFL